MKKRSIISFILVLVLVITIPCSVFIYRAVTKDDDTNPDAPGGGSSASAVSQVIHAVEEVADRNYEIIGDYSANKSADAQNYATSLNLTQLNDYFGSFSQTIIVPAAFDYVFKAAGSGVYQNSFVLGQTYFSRETSGENTYIYYFKAEKEGSLINLYYGFQDDFIVCQVEYDFENDKLITAKTIAREIFAIVDYERNYYTFAQFETSKSLQDVLDGNFSYDDITANSDYEKMYTGNIAKNINSIDFEVFEFDGSETNKNIFNNYIKEFKLDVDCENIFEYSNAVINNSFIGAMEYSTRRLGYYEIKEVDFEYQYFTYWINYEDIISLLEELKNSQKLAGDENSRARSFLNSYRNYLIDRGEATYTGDCSYSFGDNMISVSKSGEELGAYIVTIYLDGEVIQICCKDTDISLEIKEDTAYISTSFQIEVDGEEGSEYVIITRATTAGSVIDIPETMEVDGYGVLPVKKVGQESSYDYFYTTTFGSNYDTLILNIPASIEEIYTNSWLDVAMINVAEENTHYCSVDGVLYTEDMETLVRYPAYKKATEYDIPNGVKYLAEDSFQGVEYLKTLNVPSTVIDGIETRHFWASHSLENININSGSVYTSYNGIVYSADGKTLIMCPAGKVGVVTIKNGTETIGEYSFGYCKFVTEIVIPDSVTSMYYDSFSLCESLKTLTIGKNVSFGYWQYLEFDGLNSLTTVNIHKDNAYLSVDENGFVYNKDKTILYFCPRNYVGKVTIAATVTKIADSAFDSCTKITEVVISANVEEIGTRAFMYSSATKITILGNVAIDYEAFFRGSLKELYIKGLRNFEGEDYAFEWTAFDEAGIDTITFGGTRAEFEAAISDRYDFSWTGLNKLTVKCTDGDLVYTND